MNNLKNNNNLKGKPFSYPYNFVSLGDEKKINRKKREDEKEEKYSGKIKCRLKNLTPIFIGNKDNEKAEKTLTLKVEGSEKYVIPASTLKGEIRNIIEILTTSCIKNVEEKRLSHRRSFNKNNSNSRENIYGIIDKFPSANGDGRILGTHKIKIKIKDKKNNTFLLPEYKKEGFYPIKVNEKYENHISSDKKTDDPKIDDSKAINNPAQFEEIVQGGTIDAILWVSSDIFNKKYEKILVPNGKSYTFTMEEYKDLIYLIDERKKNEEKNKRNFYIDELKIKDAIIFEADEYNKAKKLAFSEIPRLRYKLSPLDLVPKDFRPCNSEELCFACRMFGTIGDNTKSKEENDNSKNGTFAISSKVFISDALSINEKNDDTKKIMEDVVTLDSLGEPHPSLASFYLEKGTYDNKISQIRGRKFYWHHEEKIKAGTLYKNYLNSIKNQGDNKKVVSTIQFLQPHQIFQFEISFKNLTKEELGILIYSLELEPELLHKFGKAKALGFGSCEIKITDCLLESPEKYNSFVKTYKKIDKEEYLKLVKEKYKLNTNERKEIKELKAILKSTNYLDFKESPYPKEKGKIKGNNTVNWFVNRSNDKNFKLPHILDYKKK